MLIRLLAALILASSAYAQIGGDPGGELGPPTIPPALVLESLPTQLAAGDTVTLSAYIQGDVAYDTVTFLVGQVVLGVTPVTAWGEATLQVPMPTAGNFTVVARHTNLRGTLESNSVTIQVVPRTSSTALSANPSSAAAGRSVTLKATVGGANPGGTVTFKDGPTALGTSTLSAGIATLATTFSTAGSHSLTANYAGDANNTASVSPQATVLVSTGGGPNAPGPMTWQYAYDAQGNRTLVVDPNGNQTTTGYDPLSRPTSVTQPAPGAGQAAPVIGYQYDGRDQVTRVTDPRKLATRYTLDGLGNVQAQTSPDSGNSTASYDAAGNVTSRTDARGKTTGYGYDPIGRLTTITYASGTPTVFEYDGGTPPVANSIGQVSKITDESGQTTYTHDGLGRVLTKAQVVGTGAGAKTFTVSYGWGSAGSANGKLASITYPSGSRVNYSYDAAGRLASITINPVNANGVGTGTSSISLLAGIGYSGANDLMGWTWGNGDAAPRTVDTYGRPLTYPLGKANGTGMAAGLTRTLTYDNAGRILGYTHANAAGAQAAFDQGFAYDGLDRLNESVINGLYFGYGYDATGNRTALVTSTASYLNQVDALSNRLLQVQVAGTTGTVNKTYQYDAMGNLTSDGTVSYAYSDRGRLASSTLAGVSTQYRYNGLEQRVSKVGSAVPSGAAYFVYDEAGQVLGEYDANLAPLYETVYLDNAPVGVLKQSGSAAAATLETTVAYVYADHLATPRVITRSTDQAILWRWDTSEAFGNTAPNDNPSGLGRFVFNQRLPGQVADVETGNFQNWHREYQAHNGRYTQADPIGLVGGFGTYSYVGANPVLVADKTGLWWKTFHENWSYTQAMDTGWNYALAVQLGSLVAGVDDEPGSQAREESYRHAMRDPSWSVEEALARMANYVNGNLSLCTIRGLANALHAIQDGYSPSHRGFQIWWGIERYSLVQLVPHAILDSPLMIRPALQAIQATRETIKLWNAKCGCPK